MDCKQHIQSKEDSKSNSLKDREIHVEDDLISLDFSEGINFDEKGNIKRNSGIIKDCYVCVRPGNKKSVPKVYVETLEGGRIVSNNYGHGGIGWSLCWGSAQKSVEFLDKKLQDEGKSLFEVKIGVVGAGCVGCATVLTLIEKGVDPNNIEIFTEKLENLTSHKSGAFLSTASVLEEVTMDLKQLYDDLHIDSYNTWDKIEKGEIFPKLQEGVLRIKAYFGAEKEWGAICTDSGMDIFVNNGMIPPPELVYLKFQERQNLFRKYDSFYFNTFKLMRAFYKLIDDYKIKINLDKIEHFSKIDTKFGVIFNCTGLSNMTTFNKDEDILPIAGHIITLRNQEIKKFKYVIYTHYIPKEDIGKYSYTNSPLFYFMPKTDGETYSGLLGGSFYHHYHGGDENIDEKEYKGVMRRTMEIFGQDAEAEKLI